MSVVLSSPINNVYTTLTSAYTTGSRSLVVADSGLFVTTPAAATTSPIRLTAVTAASYGTANETLTIFSCSGVNTGTNTLTVDPITSGIDASTDRPFAIGDIIEVRMTAGTIKDINSWIEVPSINVVAVTPTLISGSDYSVAINCANGSAFYVALVAGGAHAFTVSNLVVGQSVKITTLQPSGTPGTVSWAGQTIRWSGGTVGAPTNTANKADIFVLYSPATGLIGGTVSLPNF